MVGLTDDCGLEVDEERPWDVLAGLVLRVEGVEGAVVLDAEGLEGSNSIEPQQTFQQKSHSVWLIRNTKTGIRTNGHTKMSYKF